MFPAQFPIQTPVRTDFGKSSQDLMGVQLKELLQGPMAKLTWSFPSLPEEPQQSDVPFELLYPVPANSVAAQCGENSVYVEVMKDFFGTGHPVLSSGFTLGGCTATGEDTSAQVLIFESELHGCSGTSMVTEDELVYRFNIIYTPQEASYGVPIVRSSGAVVGIECHYPRTHNVSSDALMPTWIPYASTKVAEEVFVFSLKLMTDDWRFERPSNQYFLGDMINLEASVRLYSHVPVRVFVDSCVATAVPDVASVPRYSFIENNGCLVDAKLTGSTSSFMPRTQGDKLGFQLEAFRFQQADSGLVYITCTLKVAAATSPSSEQKACSFSANGVENNKAGSGRSTAKCRKSADYQVFTPTHKHYPRSVSHHHRVHISQTGSHRSCFKYRKCARCTALTPAHENDCICATHTRNASAYEPSLSWQCFKCRSRVCLSAHTLCEKLSVPRAASPHSCVCNTTSSRLYDRGASYRATARSTVCPIRNEHGERIMSSWLGLRVPEYERLEPRFHSTPVNSRESMGIDPRGFKLGAKDSETGLLATIRSQTAALHSPGRNLGESGSSTPTSHRDSEFAEKRGCGKRPLGRERVRVLQRRTAGSALY
ncbi:unnamed protein product [Leuciscus chuanchicus]